MVWIEQRKEILRLGAPHSRLQEMRLQFWFQPISESFYGRAMPCNRFKRHLSILQVTQWSFKSIFSRFKDQFLIRSFRVSTCRGKRKDMTKTAMPKAVAINPKGLATNTSTVIFSALTSSSCHRSCAKADAPKGTRIKVPTTKKMIIFLRF